MRPRLRSLLALACLAFHPGAPGFAAEDEPPARAPEDPRPAWAPGNPTTSSLPGEVKGSNAVIEGDGVYGRFDGPFLAGVHGGLLAGEHGSALAARVAAHYLFTAGVYAGYEAALSDDDPSRGVASFGVDLQPAFLPRWSLGLEQGPAALDLFLDSISLGLGGYLRRPSGGDLGDTSGFELSLGAGVPLAAEVDAVWLSARGLLRWDDPGGDHARRAEAVALATLGVRFTIGTSTR